MFDLHLRVLKDRFLEPVVVLMQQNNLTPNKISLLAFAMGLTCAFFAALGCVWLSVLFWSLNRILDGVDGLVARRTNQATDFGGYLDIVLDFIVYGLVPIGIVHGNFSVALCYVVLLLECTYFVNAAGLFYLSALLEKNNLGANATGEMTSVTMPTALIEGTETVVAYFIFLLFPQWSVVSFALFGLAVAVTIGQRLEWASRTLDKKKGK